MPSFIDSEAAWTVGGVSALIATAISTYSISSHLFAYKRPLLQRPIVRIILIIPIYAFSSWLSLRYPTATLYFAVVRDCYEAYIIYLFLLLLLAYMGGEGACLSSLEQRQSMPHPCACGGKCLPQIKLDTLFLRRSKQGALQFVLMKPLFAFISLILLAAGYYEDATYQALLMTVYNISYTLALYELGLIYMATKPFISQHRPVIKFLAVKTIVFATYYQSLILLFIGGGSDASPSPANSTYSSENHDIGWSAPTGRRTGAGTGAAVGLGLGLGLGSSNNDSGDALATEEDNSEQWVALILCVEMVFFAILLHRAFPAREFRRETSVGNYTAWNALLEVLNVRDVVADTRRSFSRNYVDQGGGRGESLLFASQPARPVPLAQNLDLSNDYADL